jgi:imidazole glycerol phosphate synthase glutamine amidotransferase subunit
VSQWIGDERPFLGICLGLQLLFERSEESPKARGLGIFGGNVVKFQLKKLQVPHMGWNTVEPKQNRKFGIAASDYFYFVHSYFPEPKDKKIIFTRTDYGRGFCSAVAKKNLVATQYHPEKSGEVGLRFLKNVVSEMKEAA